MSRIILREQICLSKGRETFMTISFLFSPPRSNRLTLFVLYLIPLLIFVARGYSQSACINQSPRSLTLNRTTNGERPALGLDYNFTSTTPVVTFEPNSVRTVNYQGRILRLCDQHYHVPVENIQNCPNEKNGEPPPHGTPAPVGQWIEWHAVYAGEVDTAAGCAEGPDRNLACCKQPPFVVRGFSAKVARSTSDPVLPMLPQPTAGRLVEWTGSNTGPDDATGCKQLPVQWSFRLGCQFEVPQNQLDPHKYEAHGARAVQAPNRVSPDMSLVGNKPEDLNDACRLIRTAPIDNNAVAQLWGCPVVCKPPLSEFRGDWTNVYDGKHPLYAECTCCPLPRPR
jgi:hypothetical protein